MKKLLTLIALMGMPGCATYSRKELNCMGADGKQFSQLEDRRNNFEVIEPNHIVWVMKASEEAERLTTTDFVETRVELLNMPCAITTFRLKK